MLSRPRALRAALCVCVALGGAAGCLLVTPLDDLPATSGGNAHGGTSAGGTSHGGASSGASGLGGTAAGEAGAPMNVAGETNVSGECRSNAECVQQSMDEPYRCRPSDHTCVALKNDACPLAYGDASDPNAIFFGAFATLNPIMPGDNSIIWAHELARDELSGDNVRGLPDGPNDTRRPLVMVVCDNTGDVVTPGLEHLVKEVQVPAIIATLKPGALLDSFDTYRKQDIFYLSPVSVTSTVVTEKDDGLIWNLLGQPSDMAPTYAKLLELVEKRLRKERHLAPTDQLKVAFVTTKAAFDSELAAAVSPLLNFNGLDATGNDKNFAGFTLDAADPELPTQLLSTADDIATLGADVVISAASEPFSMDQGLLETIEDEWGGLQPNKPRPFYILSPYNAGNLDQIMKLMNDFIDGGVEADPEQRFVGVSIAGPRDNTLQNRYALRLHTAFKKAAIADTANYYDAIYYLAYAMYAADSGQELTGSSIARGMQRLLSGDSFDVGPSGINGIFEALSTAGASVHINSTLGPPDFDPKTGVRAVDGSVLCFSKMGSTVQLRADVLRYDTDSKTLSGTFPCFDGFFP